MKKVLCTVLALAMALALLAGCGGAPASSGSTAASGSAGNAENATIKVAALVSGYENTYPGMWQEVCDAFTAQTGINVELTLEQNLEDVLNASMQGGDYPDVIHLATGRPAGLTEQFINGKMIADITDVLDILIVAFLIYKVLGFIRETRAEQLAKGLLVLVVITMLSEVLHLYTLHWLLSGLMTVGLVAIVVIFQPELRRGLEYLGRSRISNVFGEVNKEEAKHIVGEFVEAIEAMSSTRTGALIVIERQTALNDIIETGTIINTDISAQMIGTIFYEGTPLHDGAVIVRGDRLYAAGCVLPLTQNKDLNKELGTRHRAGIGITENSDALVIIVSEETGVISIAQNGKLTRFLDGKKIEKTLLNLYLEEEVKVPFTERLRRLLKGGQRC